jgi:hypothetical protein
MRAGNAMPAHRICARTVAFWRAAVALALLLACASAPAQPQGRPAAVLPTVTITATPGDSVEKSYRRMVAGMDLFERLHPMAPQASLRFKLLPRRRDTDMKDIVLEVVGNTVDIQVPIAPDNTFSLVRNAQAWTENAVVTPNRRSRSMTWRTDIRTPGLPPGTRRLGDLRLECRVGLEAGLVSNNASLISPIVNALSEALGYCERKDVRYLFFADRPLFSVTLVAGARREILPVARLYAAAIDDPGLPQDLPYCDCEVLVDRTYFLPLGDTSWPDDTRIVFDYMDDGDASTSAGRPVTR